MVVGQFDGWVAGAKRRRPPQLPKIWGVAPATLKLIRQTDPLPQVLKVLKLVKSRYANKPASVVTWLPQKRSFNRLSKLTRKSSFFASPIGFPCQLGMIWQNTPAFQGSGANRMPKCGKSNGEYG